MFSIKKSPPKKWHYIALVVIIVAAIAFKIYAAWWPKTLITIGNQTISALVADTLPHRIEGWSNKKDMGKYQGMLFVFPDRGQHTMVMRDMAFPLDVVWLDGKTIVDIAPNLAPEPGRTEAQLTPYFSRLPSTLVLELPAGFTSQNNIKVGDMIEIKQ